MQLTENLLQRAANIKLVIFDVDGVLTDGTLVLGPHGEEFKHFHVRDGQGLVMLRDSGFILAIITGRKSTVVAERMQQLGIHHVYQGQSNKLDAFEALLAVTQLDPEAVCYVGDDLPDLPVMMKVGLSFAPRDAHNTVTERATAITEAAGGKGAVREVCDLILKAQEKWDAQISRYI